MQQVVLKCTSYQNYQMSQQKLSTILELPNNCTNQKMMSIFFFILYAHETGYFPNEIIKIRSFRLTVLSIFAWLSLEVPPFQERCVMCESEVLLSSFYVVNLIIIYSRTSRFDKMFCITNKKNQFATKKISVQAQKKVTCIFASCFIGRLYLTTHLPFLS